MIGGQQSPPNTPRIDVGGIARFSRIENPQLARTRVSSSKGETFPKRCLQRPFGWQLGKLKNERMHTLPSKPTFNSSSYVLRRRTVGASEPNHVSIPSRRDLLRGRLRQPAGFEGDGRCRQVRVEICVLVCWCVDVLGCGCGGGGVCVWLCGWGVGVLMCLCFLCLLCALVQHQFSKCHAPFQLLKKAAFGSP